MNGPELVHQARAAGLLPEHAQWPSGDDEAGGQRPWPVVLLTALAPGWAAVP